MSECYYVGWLNRKSEESGMLEYVRKTRFSMEFAMKLEKAYSNIGDPNMLYWYGTDDPEEVARTKKNT